MLKFSNNIIRLKKKSNFFRFFLLLWPTEKLFEQFVYIDFRGSRTCVNYNLQNEWSLSFPLRARRGTPKRKIEFLKVPGRVPPLKFYHIEVLYLKRVLDHFFKIGINFAAIVHGTDLQKIMIHRNYWSGQDHVKLKIRVDLVKYKFI